MRLVGKALLACVVLFPAAVFAQQAANSVIAGTVRDASGGVLPGATVEAASPALIERVRTVVTDGQGLYRVTDLRPGTYTITFTLPGFATVRREGLELPSNFTATVNADLRVGTLEETVTVTGESPVVDVQTLTATTRLSNQTLDSLPTARNVLDLLLLNPAAQTTPSSRSTGGAAGETDGRVSIHGGRSTDQKVSVDGMRFNVTVAGNMTVWVNPLSTQDILIETAAGGSAEYDTGGAQMNVIPKDGGNSFSGGLFANYANSHFQSDNLTSDLEASGVRRAPPIRRIYELNGVYGGRIKSDRLWFLAAPRWWGVEVEQIGFYPNKLPATSFRYEPDLSRPGVGKQPNASYLGRLTYQASRNNKLTFQYDHQPNCDCPEPTAIFNRAVEAAVDNLRDPNDIWQATHTFVATNQLLFETGGGLYWGNLERLPIGTVTGDYAPPSYDAIPVQENSTGFQYNNFHGINPITTGRSLGSLRSSLSFITGTHQFKVGTFWTRSSRAEVFARYNHQLQYRFNNGVPVQLVQIAGSQRAPNVSPWETTETNFFVQDRWTRERLTVSMGLRFGRYVAHGLASDLPADDFLPARSLPEAKCIPCFNDIAPRVGAAYDLFGTGKTAVKASFGKYMSHDPVYLPFIPRTASVSSVTRSWADANTNFVPDCNLRSPLANGECGQMSDLNFGGQRVTTVGDPDWITGWGKRGYNWQGSVQLEHELMPNVGMSLSYHRTSYANFTVTDNIAVTPDDFDEYCITAPADRRLPGGGGYPICGLANITPTKFGQVNNVVRLAEHFGKYTEVYNGGELDINARMRNGALLTGGLTIGNSRVGGGGSVNRCFVMDSPQELYNCDINPPYRPQLKLGAAYPLPWDVQASVNFQNTPGAAIAADYEVANAAIQPSLGRPLAGGARSVTIPLIAPESMFGPRVTTVDLRFTKGFQVRGLRTRGMLDLYNVANASTVLSSNGTYGPTWQQPQTILGGRLVKVGMKLDF